MPNQPLQPEFGNPEFWQIAHDAFPKFFEVTFRLNEALVSITDRAYQEVEPVQKVILNLGILTGISMMELITLVGNGFGLGAMKIARSMLESAINAEYLRRFPGNCDEYLQWHWVEQHKLLDTMRRYNPESLKQISQEDIKKAETEFRRVRSMFEYETGRGKKKLRTTWCSIDLGARAAKTDFLQPYSTIHPLASRILHGSIGGLAAHFKPDDEEGPRISVPPSLSWCGQALIGGHLCTIRVVETLSKTFAVEPRHSLEELSRDFHYVWMRPPATQLI